MASTGYQTGVAASSTSPFWTSAANALTDNGQYATITVNGGTNSGFLSVSNMGFSIPGSATIDGIQIQVQTLIPSAGPQFETVTPYYAGNSFTKKTGAVPFNPIIQDLNTVFGSSTDVWGDTGLTPTKINGTGFGVDVRISSSATAGISVDVISMNIYYTEAPGDVNIIYYGF